MKMLIERIRTAVNFLDESNFPSGVSGEVLTQHSVPLNRLAQGEYHLPMVLLTSPITTSSTTFINVGVSVEWLPPSWGLAHMYLAVQGGIETTGVAEFRLVDQNSVSLGMLSVGTPGMPYNSIALNLPLSQGLLTFQMRSVTGSVVQLLGAKIIIEP